MIFKGFRRVGAGGSEHLLLCPTVLAETTYFFREEFGKGASIALSDCFGLELSSVFFVTIL
jgi:hypothetical protein